MSLVVSIGKWGGFYFSIGYSKRICLGWMALTFIPIDFDILMDQALPRKNLEQVKDTAA